MSKINGFSLVESMVSLLLFSVVCSFLLPTAMTIFEKLDQQKETSKLYQQMFEHSELLRHKSVPINFNEDPIKSFPYQGGIQICAKNKTEQKCVL
ncbi:competence type IV pilus minor pilin ComGE [Listeria swaminathanii]|uniref:Competence type IV pilus minor pilin ComGE n=1 Tax=Listeria swaminathanii TaxID=2713501 RepID=A0A7X1A0K9_9LIST|nr:competence type IV pilus minor pilin ComGE [Listeria swaminathanii]UHP11394.1 type II secretion system GspH family protein [Listeria marthii]MBC2329469.1 type II secretion system protein [Listeria swaminathanii]MDT0016624.1 competence type IV pilus minor pilin ComGE [Listeria swaminathanii]MDT0022060.1 competence type IV pilus minor pilin ComGE [Listeria swaminathanii]MDT0033024.1 competence type IV pilus minor pilin ComGE [Listeria swaminathanii]